MDIPDAAAKVVTDVFELHAAPEMSTPLRSLATWDSLRFVLLVAALEGEFGVEFTSEAIAEMASLEAVSAQIELALGQRDSK